MKEYLRNFWYAAARRAEVDATTAQGKPLQSYVIGQRLCIFQDASGKIAAINDTCPHMGAPLSLGTTGDGCVQCPYHHFQFAGSGKCTKVPSIPPGGKISALLQVDSYPVEERYGIIWVFMGDLDENCRPDIVDIPEFTQTGYHTALHDSFTWTASCRAQVENLLDFTHFTHVHANTFGAGEHPFSAPYRVHHLPWGCTATVKVKLSEVHPIFPPQPELGVNPDVSVCSRFHLPSVVVNTFTLGRYSDVNMFAFTPAKGREVRIYWISHNDYLEADAADLRVSEFGQRILGEDLAVLEHCHPDSLPMGGIAVPVDRYVVACRRLYDQHLAKQTHSIAPFISHTDAGEDLVTVPSPARKTNQAFGRVWRRSGN